MATKKKTRKKATRRKVTKKKPAPVIDLSTLTNRTTIHIDGKPYEIRNRRELSVLQLRRLEGVGEVLQRIGELEPDEITDEHDREASEALDRACRMVLIAPDAVHEKLCDADRLQINAVFTMAASASDALVAGASKKTTK